MRRREFITLLGGAAARRHGRWLRVHSASPGTNVDRLRGFRHGLQETCHAEDQNVAIEYRGLKINSIGFLFAPGFRRAESLAIAPLSFFDLHHKSK